MSRERPEDWCSNTALPLSCDPGLVTTFLRLVCRTRQQQHLPQRTAAANESDNSDAEAPGRPLWQTGSLGGLPHPHPAPFLPQRTVQDEPLCGPRLPPLPRAGELGGCCPATSGSGSHIFFTLSSKQRKLEAQGSAEAPWGQEVQSTQSLSRGGGFAAAAGWGWGGGWAHTPTTRSGSCRPAQAGKAKGAGGGIPMQASGCPAVRASQGRGAG